MSIDNAQKRKYIGYEYKKIMAAKETMAFLIDAYENFGWEVAENYPGKNSEVPAGISYHRDYVVLKRNRKIINKMELTRLQRHFEACMDEINELERNKTSLATVYALAVGIIGTAFMAASVFVVTAEPPKVLLCIILAVPGFLGWILPYFIYKRAAAKKTDKLIPLIEAKYDEIDEICERGSKLLNLD